MERADKYYMAICNTTGMIAVYNPDKNLFMSPLADGPIQFSGTINQDDMNIEHITKFGRSFSIVCVPYSFKLLMQELQSINVHMRIITEDNIDQIENMSFSNNIQKLTHNEHLDTKETIEKIQQDIRKLLRESKTQKFVIEDNEDNEDNISSVPESPVYQPMTPEMPPLKIPDSENIEESPPYVVGTPTFQPVTPPMTPPMTPTFQPVTPPMTPPMTPVSNSEIRPKTFFVDTPSDDESSPPPPPPTDKIYKGGDRVSYMKDKIPGRPWIVTPLNKPNLYKIESEGANQEIEVVTPLDIKPYETHIPLPGYGEIPPPQIPSINIAPVFNIPGNTSMSGQPNMNQNNTNDAVKIPTNDFISNDPSISLPDIPDTTQKENSSAKMDFNNIIIKKV